MAESLMEGRLSGAGEATAVAEGVEIDGGELSGQTQADEVFVPDTAGRTGIGSR